MKAEDRLKERSAIALLCGSILRAFSWGWSVIPTGAMRTNKRNSRTVLYMIHYDSSLKLDFWLT